MNFWKQRSAIISCTSLIKAEAHNLDFTPDCPLDVLIAQIHHMGNYLHAMEVRAEYEGIDLGFCIKSLLHDLESAEGGCCVNAEDPTRYYTPCSGVRTGGS